jgi:hypothetical protein
MINTGLMKAIDTTISINDRGARFFNICDLLFKIFLGGQRGYD